MFPTTVERVAQNTSDEINQQIRRQTEECVAWTVRKGPAAIAQRLDELDQEWDIERTLEANASTITLAGLILGITVDRKFLAIPIGVAGFLLIHALQGWCPPLPILRRLGVRTQSEIEAERYALKALRGDFQKIGEDGPRNREQAADALRSTQS